MRRLMLEEVNDRYSGILPADAVFRPDENEEPASTPPPTKLKRRGRSERFAMLNSFVDMGMADLTGAETKVWLILFRDTKASGTARTGQTDIARRAGLTVRHTKRALGQLQAKGMIRLVHRGRLNVGPSIYAVHSVGTLGDM